MKPTRATIEKILYKSNCRCFYCGIEFKDGVKYEIDHFLPFSIHKDGTTKNLVAACQKCNRIKSNLDIEGFRHKVETMYGIEVIFFFEYYGIQVHKNGVTFNHTLNLKTFNHG